MDEYEYEDDEETGFEFFFEVDHEEYMKIMPRLIQLGLLALGIKPMPSQLTWRLN